MQLTNNITTQQFSQFCQETFDFINKLSEIDIDSSLLSFSDYFQQTFPSDLPSLDKTNDYFSGEKSQEFLTIYEPLLEIWKDIQQTFLPFSDNTQNNITYKKHLLTRLQAISAPNPLH